MRKALAILALAVLVASCDGPGPKIEQPPPPYNEGPTTAYVWYVTNPDDPCSTLLGDPGFNRSFRGCYLPVADMVIMPSSCDPDSQLVGETCRQLLAHEMGHARGWRHAPILGE